MRLELPSLLIEIGALNVSLRADRDIFAGGHRHGSGHRCGYRGGEVEAGWGARRNDADGNAGDRNYAVVCAEHSGS